MDLYKYLGVTFDQHLRWDRHTKITSKRIRIRRIIYKFRRLRHIADNDLIGQFRHSTIHC